ncbi:MAG: signal peptidase I [Oligoflexus sp.]|jgi:signal peptidase I
MSETKKLGFWSSENLRQLAILIFLIFCFRWSVASPYHVPTASMEPTIKVGDRLLAFKLSYGLKVPFTDISVFEWGKPKRGDIIVFRYPKDPEIDYVKRIVGLPGDRIRIDNNILYINDVAQERTEHNFDRSILSDIQDNADIKTLYLEKLENFEHWVMQDKLSSSLYAFNQKFPDRGEYTVPENSFFVMGDNRDNSTDSRSWGQVPEAYVKGKALFVLWSMHSKEDEFWPNLRWNRFGHSLH